MSWATVEGARALGLADRVGRIEPGLQADLATIEALMIAGAWRKRDHQLPDVDLANIESELSASSHGLLSPTE